MAKVHIVLSEDDQGHVHLDGVMTSLVEANKAAAHIKKFWNRKTRVESRETNNTLGFMVGYWHTRRDAEGKVTETAKLVVTPFEPE